MFYVLERSAEQPNDSIFREEGEALEPRALQLCVSLFSQNGKNHPKGKVFQFENIEN